MSNLRTYMFEIGEVIGQTLTSEGFGAQLLRAKQGPLTLSYKLQLLNPKQGDLEKVLRLGPLLENNTTVGPVRLSREVGAIIIEFPSPDPVTPHGSMLAKHSQGRNICIGFDRWGEPIYLSLPRFPNLLVSGPPRSGKTSAMRSLVYSALRIANSATDIKAEVMICAEKVEYWSPFELAQGFGGMFSTQATINHFLTELDEEMKEIVSRKEHFRPARIIVLDDLMSILSGNNEAVSHITSLVSLGGSVGLYIFIGTQNVGSKAGTGGQQVEDNMVARLLYRTSSRSAAARATGEGGEGLSELTTRQGDALLVMGHDRLRIATGFVSDEDIISDLPRRTRRPRFIALQVGNGGEKETPEPPKHREPEVIRENRTVQVALPVIKPARELTPNEAQQVLDYLAWLTERGESISKNKLLYSLFGNKNPKYVQYLMDALGDKASVYFPPKETA